MEFGRLGREPSAAYAVAFSMNDFVTLVSTHVLVRWLKPFSQHSRKRSGSNGNQSVVWSESDERDAGGNRSNCAKSGQ